MSKMNELPLTLKCPVGGEEWPATGFQCTIDNQENITPRNIHFHCPANHYFTLRQALTAETFTPEQGKRILEAARKQKAEFWHNARYAYISKDLGGKPCEKCGDKADWESANGRALCLKCHDEWVDFIDGKLPQHAHWKKHWARLFEKFIAKKGEVGPMKGDR